MRTFIAFITFLMITTLAFSAELIIPFSCYPKDLQTEFAKQGMKLDLSANDRTEDSWGFIESRGSEYSIYTYNQVDNEDLNLIRRIIFNQER